MWLRWTLPRPRIDQVLYACVKVLLPLACVLLLGAALWQLARSRAAAAALPWRDYNPFNFAEWVRRGLRRRRWSRRSILTLIGVARIRRGRRRGSSTRPRAAANIKQRLTDPAPIDEAPDEPDQTALRTSTERVT